ncbi:MAG: SLC13 family permease [Halanaeroarchaeum sp.]
MTDVGRPRFRFRSVSSAGLVLGAIVLLAGATADAGWDPTEQMALALGVFAITMWTTKSVPISISSVAIVSLLPLLGLVEGFSAAASGFATRLIFFLILLFLLGEVVAKTDLDEQFAKRLILASSTPKRSFQKLSEYLFVVAIFMPSGIARAITFVPLVDTLNDMYGLSDRSDFLDASFLFLGHVNPIASLALMTGGGMALLSSEIIRMNVRPVGWLEWAVYMVPPVLTLYFAAVLLIQTVYQVDDATSASVADDVGPMTGEQRIVAVVMTVTISLWLAGSLVGIPTILPPLLAVVVLAAPGIGIVTGSDVGNLNWDVLLMVGAVLSLVDVLQSSGALERVIDALLAVVPLATYPTWLSVLAILSGTVIVRMLFSTGSACLAVTLPVIIPLAKSTAGLGDR